MIRYASPVDVDAIAEVTETAFGRPDEARLVEALRRDGDVMFELVARKDDRVVGHILYSRLYADQPELLAALAPVSVIPDRQGQGVGAALVRASLESAREFGAHGVLVLGDPAYYGRFGFTAAAAAQVTCPFSGLDAFQALALEPGALSQPVRVAYPDAFGS